MKGRGEAVPLIAIKIFYKTIKK